ncbi:MAG TPA: RNA-binding cell elongation regulator Jag/EloR [Acidimicrobiales bacterium]|nr:RNA-binding cell elongation regulator Jag/EloR [Acidimicrobiales bacterium]
MEWVEVAGKTIEEATEQALDQLGVGPGDAEVVVINEPKLGLFGRVRVEARVRARVRPVGARPKRERSRRGDRSRQGDRPRSGSSGSRSRSSGSGRASGGNGSADAEKAHSTGGGDNGSSGRGNLEGSSPADPGRGQGTGASRSARRRRNRSRAATAGAGAGATVGATEIHDRSQNGSTREPSHAQAPSRSTEGKETVDMAEGMTLEEQGEIGRTFLAGLLAEYGVEATVESRLLDDETVEIAAVGDDKGLGMLVGPRGSTLAALQDLTRAVVQRQCPSRTDRILVDVAGYRERRSAALKRFSVQIAEEVISSGHEKALEAMSPADRKAVHDAINEMDGVVTRSEGEDPHRHVVIAPAS